MSNAEREQFSTISTFERPGVPLAYDALVRMMYAPVGGSRAMRETAIDALGITPGTRVLELGCGTGSMTELLVARGADVVAVDGSARMIARARTKAPAAQFEHSRLEDYRTDRKFDQVLFAFVLHEQSASNRKEMLSAAARFLAPGGCIAVVDHAVPERGVFARAWRSFLLRLEPPSVAEIVERGYREELEAAGMTAIERLPLAAGTAELTIGRHR
jgi:ubiquinone/menaquinone biosynthesis C-methylase UbiE